MQALFKVGHCFWVLMVLVAIRAASLDQMLTWWPD